MCVGLVSCKLLLPLAAAATVGLIFLLLAADTVSRCRCCFYLLLLCWLAAFVGRLGDGSFVESRFECFVLTLGVGRL